MMSIDDQEDSLTSPAMVDEEADYIDSVKDNTVASFDIDTTTTVIRLTDGSLVLHSPAQATGSLIFEIARLGSTVSAIIAPNLQHWLGCASWAALFPQVRHFLDAWILSRKIEWGLENWNKV